MLNFRKIVHEKLFNDINYRKIRDHCHYADKNKGPAQSICNLKFNVPIEILVVFHNFQNTVTILL